MFRPSHGALALLALPGAVLGATPLWAPGELTAERAAAAVVLLGGVSALLLLPWARQVSLSEQTLRQGLRSHAITRAVGIRLADSGYRNCAQPYAAWLEFPGERWLLAADSDPARILRCLVPFSRTLRVPIHPAWGLSESAARALSILDELPAAPRSTAQSSPPGRLQWTWQEQPHQSQAAHVFWLALVGIGLMLGAIVAQRIAGQEPLSAVSLSLDLGLLGMFLGLGLLVRRPAWSAELGEAVLQVLHVPAFGSPRVYTFELVRLNVVERVAAGDFQHLILVGESALAIPVLGESAQQFADRLLQWFDERPGD